MNYKFDVFLSFEGINREKINKLTEKIKEFNIKYFFDKEEQSKLWGSEVDIELSKCIEDSALFIPFITKNYHKTTWTNKEIQYARGVERDKFIHPIIIGGTSKEYINELLAENGIPKIKGSLPFEELTDLVIEDFSELLLKKVEEFKKNNPSDTQSKEYSNFTPLEKEKYEEYFNKLTQKDKKYNLEYFYFKNDELIKDIKRKLDYNRFVFIKGPLLSGKTELIKSFKEKFSNDYKVIGTIREKENRSKAIDRFSLYHHWYEIIYDEILDDAKIKRRFEPYKYKRLKKDIHQFQVKLQSIRDELELSSYLVAFLNLIDDFKTQQNYRKDLVVAVHLDNIHLYADSNAFDELKIDIEPILTGVDSVNEDVTAGIIIATRYFPLRLDDYVLVNVKNMTFDGVSALINVIEEDISASDKEKYLRNIYYYTEGHIWFVNRFLKCYLKLRMKDEFKNRQPIELSNEIFKKQKYWIDDSELFDDNKASEFEIGLKSIIEKHYDDKTDFFDFIELEESLSDLSEEKFLSNLIIKESGYGIYKTEKIIDSFNCQLLNMHFNKEHLENIITKKRKKNNG